MDNKSIESDGKAIEVDDKYSSSDYNNKLDLLNNIISNGLNKLLTEASQRNYLDPPYGRAPLPTPLMSEEEWLKNGGLNSVKSGNIDDDNNDFVFNYGFNPIKYLAEYIQWSHPDEIKKREKQRIDSFNQLNKRVQQSIKQLDTSNELKQAIDVYSSGIMWGPFTSPLSSTSVLVICQPLKPGTVIIEVSEESSFLPDNTQSYLIATANTVDDEIVKPIKYTINDLAATCKYYIRCTLKDKVVDEEIMPTFTGEKYSNGEFYTTPHSFVSDEPADEEKASGKYIKMKPVSLVCLGLSDYDRNNIDITSLVKPLVHGNSTGIEIDEPTTDDAMASTQTTTVLNCILGNILGCNNSNPIDYSNHVWKLYRGIFKDATSDAFQANYLFRQNSVILSWNDSRGGSDSELKAEEAIYKQYQYDTKKYQKKNSNSKGPKKDKHSAQNAPVLTRPPLTPSLASLISYLPIELKETATSNVYYSMPYGEHIQLFILDSRNGFLGQTQAKWLRDELISCGSLWKIVISSVPLGMDVSNSKTTSNDTLTELTNDVPVPEDDVQQEGKVKVVLPTATEDVDEDGRVKSSLEYVAAYVQKHWLQEGKKKKNKNDEANDNNTVDETGSVGEEQSVHSLDSGVSYPNDGSVIIDSGIVFITGGICSQPFVATYDPINVGVPYYCAEVGVGAFGASTASLNPVNTIGSNFLYVGNGSEIETSGYAAGINLTEDGALNIKIARHGTVVETTDVLLPNEGVGIVYDAVFRSAKMFKS